MYTYYKMRILYLLLLLLPIITAEKSIRLTLDVFNNSSYGMNLTYCEYVGHELENIRSVPSHDINRFYASSNVLAAGKCHYQWQNPIFSDLTITIMWHYDKMWDVEYYGVTASPLYTAVIVIPRSKHARFILLDKI